MEGPGKYDDACKAAMEATGAEGCGLFVLKGERGSGFAMDGSLLSHLEMASMLEDVARQMRLDAVKIIKRQTDSDPNAPQVIKDAVDAAVKAADAIERAEKKAEEKYVQTPIDDLFKLSWKAYELIKSKTQSWEEGAYTVGFIVKTMISLHAKFGKDVTVESARARVMEIITKMIDEAEMIVVEVAPGEHAQGLFQDIPDDLKERLKDDQG